MLKRTGFLITIIAALGAASPGARAQDYPTKPIRLIVPFAPGGGTDLSARIVAEGLTKSLGQNVIVENRPGAGTQLGIEYVARAPKDGYTLLWATADSISILPSVKANLPYKIPESFAFVSTFAAYSLILGVNAKLPIQDMNGFIAYAKTNPGKVHYSSAGVGSAAHLYLSYLGKQIGADMVHVPYDGAVPAAVAVAGGFADATEVAPSSMVSYISSGTVRGIAASGSKRSSLLPDVQTMAELGRPDMTADLYLGMLAPAGTPQAAVDKLAAGVDALLKQQATLDRLHSLGLEPLELQKEQFREAVVKDVAHWAIIVKESGVKVGE